MKILNLYAGIGGNRKLWGDEHDIVAVEWDQEKADIYRDFFPQDKVVVADAHEYLIENFRKFDFIWSSPPCKSHSRMKNVAIHKDQVSPEYPDFRLYEEVVLLEKHFSGDWVVENVEPYYEPFMKPQKAGRHTFWSNFSIPDGEFKQVGNNQSISELEKKYGVSLKSYTIGHDKKKEMLRNMVDPNLGLHVLKSRSRKQQTIQEVVSSR